MVGGAGAAVGCDVGVVVDDADAVDVDVDVDGGMAAADDAGAVGGPSHHDGLAWLAAAASHRLQAS